MSDYKFLGLNVWTYSERRAIAWFGSKGSHYSDKKRYWMFEVGEWGGLGLEVTVGGENREVCLRIGLGLLTLYVALTGIVPDRYKKAKEIAAQEKCHAYEIDFSGEGRVTGAMLNFRHNISISFSFWQNQSAWSARSIRQKLKRFPYCEGIGRTFFITNET